MSLGEKAGTRVGALPLPDSRTRSLERGYGNPGGTALGKGQQLCCAARSELQCKASCVPAAPLQRRRSGIAGLRSALPPSTAGLGREGQALFFLSQATRSSEGLVLVDGFRRRQGRQGGKREGRGSLLRQALWCGRERVTLHTVTLQSPRVGTPWIRCLYPLPSPS